MNIFVGICIGLGASVVIDKITSWVEDKYIENYTEKIMNELENEEIQNILKTQ